MRALLAKDQQGEPVALVSAGCEVIQINRKFFAKYLDENMLNIVALKVSRSCLLLLLSWEGPPMLWYFNATGEDVSK